MADVRPTPLDRDRLAQQLADAGCPDDAIEALCDLAEEHRAWLRQRRDARNLGADPDEVVGRFGEWRATRGANGNDERVGGPR